MVVAANEGVNLLGQLAVWVPASFSSLHLFNLQLLYSARFKCTYVIHTARLGVQTDCMRWAGLGIALFETLFCHDVLTAAVG